VNQLRLGLTEERFALLLEKFDVDNDESVRWEEFVLVIPAVLKQFNVDAREEDCWFDVSSSSGKKFFINAKTGRSQWSIPIKTNT